MKIIKPLFYKDFKCIAGACPDSCCQGWEVDADEDSLEFYKTLPPELEIKQRIESVLDKDEFDNTIFRLAPKKRCPFLNDKNLCDMHIAIGGEHTPFTCKNFPRFSNYFGATKEMGVSFSCPVAAEIMYNYDKKWEFYEENNDDLPSLNEIDAEWYFILKKTRNDLMEITFNHSFSTKDKLLKIIEKASFLWENYDSEQENICDFISLSDVFINPELINPEWEEKVANMSEKPIKNENSNNNIIAYFIYKYFLLAAYDYDVLSKLKMAIVGVLINTYIGADAWTIHLWSKETEHSQYNMDRYKRLLKEDSCLSLENLI